MDGGLSAEDREVVERHIESCDECCEAMAKVPLDTLSARLRDVETETTTDDWSIVTEPGLKKSTSEAAVPTSLTDHPRYRILEPLGRGGMGVVYKAQHRMMDRIVALKVIDGRLIQNPQAIERFRNEVKAAALLTHANIVRAYDAEQAGDLHFLVMEFVDGISLAELVKRKGPLPAEQACGVVRKVAHGLHHAFQHGMVHRDIKPQNLMVTRTGKIRILDFGLARFAREREYETPVATDVDQFGGELRGDALTQVGSILGTPDYIAPEQATDAHLADIRADIYSLGCTCYFLLTGQAPFPEGTALQKLVAHRDQTATPLTQLRPGTPPEVVAIVEKMMQRSPGDRYQTPLEVANAIDACALSGVASATATTSFSEQQPTITDTPKKSEQRAEVGNREQEQRPSRVSDVEVGASSASIETTAVESSDNDSESRDSLHVKESRPENFGQKKLVIAVVALVAIPLLYLATRTNDTTDVPEDQRGEANIADSSTRLSPTTTNGEQTGKWIDLLPLVQPATHAVAGNWAQSFDGLSVNSATFARVALPYDVPPEYNFEASFTRIDGVHSIGLIFVANGHQATFEVDAWGQNAAGIQNISGQSTRQEDSNPTRVGRLELENGRRYTIAVHVRRDRVDAYLDDQLLSTYVGDGTNLTLYEPWTLPDRPASLGLAAYESSTLFHSVRVQPVSPTEQ